MQIIVLLINKCILYNGAVFWENIDSGDNFTDSVVTIKYLMFHRRVCFLFESFCCMCLRNCQQTSWVN